MAEKEPIEKEPYYSDYIDISQIKDPDLQSRVHRVLDMFWATPDGAEKIKQLKVSGYGQKLTLLDKRDIPNRFFRGSFALNINENPRDPNHPDNHTGISGIGDAMYPVLGSKDRYEDYSLNHLLAHEIFGHAITFQASANYTQVSLRALESLYNKAPDVPRDTLREIHTLHQQVMTYKIGTAEFRVQEKVLMDQVFKELGIDQHHYDMALQQARFALNKPHEDYAIGEENEYLGPLFGKPPRDPDRYHGGPINPSSPKLDVIEFAPGMAPKGYQPRPFIKLTKKAELELDSIRSQTATVALMPDGAADPAAPSNNSKLGIG